MAQRLAALLALVSASAWPIDCQVLSVHDGDTLTASCDARVIKVRLAEIDAPERTQPYSRISTNALKRLCVGAQATITSHSIDRYGRTIGRVTCAGIDVNAEQVRRGYAWAFDKYLTDPAIKLLETEARAGHRGLWRSAQPIPPWEFRELERHH